MGEKKIKVKVLTPIGRVSYPYLDKADEGREYSDGKYSVNILIPKEEWKEKGKEIMDAALSVARAYHDKPNAKLADFRLPFRDLAKSEKCPENKKGFIAIKARTKSAPIVMGPDKKVFGPDEIKAKVVEGCYARMAITIAGYPQKPEGVTAFLGLVQYVRPGESFGEGGGDLKEMVDVIEDMEVVADVGEDDVSESHF